jgi:hypothetical protein
MANNNAVTPAHLCEQAFAQLTRQQQHEENADDVPRARGLDSGKLLHHLSGSTPRLSWPAEDLAILAAIASVLEIDHFPEDAEAHLLPDNRGGTWAIVRGNLPPTGVIIRGRDGHVLLDSSVWTAGAVSWRMEFHLDARQTHYALEELSRIEESLPSAPTVQELIEIQGADAARLHDRRFEVQPGPGPFAADVQRSLRGPIDA